MTPEGTFPCPSCGLLVFAQPPGSYDICPICDWEDDAVQLRYPTMAGGANKLSLAESQREALARVPLGVGTCDGYSRDPSWRPLTVRDIGPTTSVPSTGMDYFLSAGEGARAGEPALGNRRRRAHEFLAALRGETVPLPTDLASKAQ